MNAADQKNQYAKAICYFLAEELRTKKISLPRAAEIAQKVLDNINLIDTEKDFLRLIKDLTLDFDELFHLEERIQMSIHVSERRQLEAKVLEFVENILPQDTNMAVQILQEAVKIEVKAEDLSKKFPQFSQFLEKNKI